ncbi:hypothetical protein C7C56_020000 [Massilia glaciei]|uniref:Uncharacterized protein n=2 Tax=Massilia glaciei TaxID=1524097 RepID=A0A2U2HGL8_9BURK|nr:hypothetical protein C7C56_020000 [Massilia glaciei]
MLAKKMKAEVAPFFDQIKSAPLRPLGFGKGYNPAPHPTDTTTVRLTTTNRMKWLIENLDRIEADTRSVVDEELLKIDEGIFGDFAHLTLNLCASDKQIHSDFKNWLRAWRKHTKPVVGGDFATKVRSWASTNLVPYMDLKLFTLLTGKSIRSDRRIALIQPTFNLTERDAHGNRLSKSLPLVFTFETAEIIRHQAESAKRSFQGK